MMGLKDTGQIKGEAKLKHKQKELLGNYKRKKP
jgi:hypothetical protein